MKKIKLIKEYPGSPLLGTELTPKVAIEDNNTNNFYWEGSWFNPADFPEFWEEIIEKTYEIIGFHIGDNKITSVKRLSDGEIFTLGEDIKLTGGFSGTIIGFKVTERGVYVSGDNSSFGQDLKNLIKIKKPLYTTYDGVDIFEGDTIFGVNIDWKVFSHYTDLQNKIKSWGIKPIFSTREKAEEYILMNKPCLSLNDLLSVWGNESNIEFYKTSPMFTNFKNLINKKLYGV